MNILISDSWLREYLDTSATPDQLKEYLSLCGPSVERVTKTEGDYIYDIEITSNRVDMASVYGIAREAVAILPRFNIPAKLKELNIQKVTGSNKTFVEIIDKDNLCNRILAVAMDNVAVGKSEQIISSRIEKSGIRSLNNLIDITNYVMTELGHPCHVFDLDRIKTNKLIIRCAKKGETLVTLDGKKYNLDENDVVIDDGTERIIDLPGIMGTENSVVTNETKRILLFIESNDSTRIRKTSMKHAIRTVAATINEKHPDPECAEQTFYRAIEMYQKNCHAQMISPVYDLYPKKSSPTSVSVNIDFINKRLGINLAKNEIIKFLENLGFQVIEKGNTLNVTAPSYRQFDINIPEDVVEEVARLYGYHLLPNQIMNGQIPLLSKDKSLLWEEKIKQYLKHTGHTETYSYSMLSQKMLSSANINPNDLVQIANPLTEELVYMRNSLIPQLLSVIGKNKQETTKMKLFELSKIYLKKEKSLPDEVANLTIGYLGSSFYDLKGIVEALAKEMGISNFTVKPLSIKNNLFSMEQSGEVWIEKTAVGVIGLIKKEIAMNFSLNEEIYIADLNFTKLVEHANTAKKYQSISQFPPLIQDLALKVKPKTKFEDLVNIISGVSELVKKVELLDVYEDTKTLRVIFQSQEKTLEEKEITKIREDILKKLDQQLGAKLKLTANKE